MPDRAVVDDAYWTDPLPTPGLPRCPLCDAEMMPNIGGTWTCHKDHTPQPRAIVALSDDRQWLVVLEDGTWCALAKFGSGMLIRYELRYLLTDDTGQDAYQVLAAFLEGRNA